MRRLPAIAALALILASVTACGGDDGVAEDTAPATTIGPPADADPADAADQTTSADQTITTESDAAADAATTSEPSRTGPSRPALGLPELTLLTEPSDEERPLLEWEPVDGAAQYSISVFAPSGAGYWAWRTDGTSVPLGGEPRLRDDVSGPSTVAGMTWSVVALDADGRPIAASVESVLRR